jgi:hypothetical protein
VGRLKPAQGDIRIAIGSAGQEHLAIFCLEDEDERTVVIFPEHKFCRQGFLLLIPLLAVLAFEV